MPENTTLVNFVAGETAPKSRGRFDLDWYRSSLRKAVNFIAEIPGSVRYRAGFRRMRYTRGNALARLIPFQVNDSLVYMLEFTPGYMRVYQNNELLMSEVATVTGVSVAGACAVTASSVASITAGDTIIITGVTGMPQIENRELIVGTITGSAFQVLDPLTGTVDSSAYDAYTSGGTIYKVYELASPYLAGELDDISFAASNATMYLAHPRYAPRKVTVDSGGVFTLATYSRTNDPFSAEAAVSNVVGITFQNSAVYVHFASGSVIYEGVNYTFAGIVGTTGLNGNTYRMGISNGWPYPTGQLQTTANVTVPDTGLAAWVSGGTATPAAENPIAVGFYESRLGFFGTNQRPNTFFLSRATDDDGDPRYDDFTGGTDEDHACFFALAPANGQIDYISWARGTSEFLFIGTYGGTFRVSGSGTDEAIAPASILVKQVDLYGCEATAPAGTSRVFFIQRGGTALRVIQPQSDTGLVESFDMTLNAEHIAYSRIEQAIVQSGRPDVIWIRRDDGVLAGLTVHNQENAAGWHRHKIGGEDARAEDIQACPRTDANDQLWAVISRTVDGETAYSVEFMADDPEFPDYEDFYTGPANEDADIEKFDNVLYRRQEEYIHVDGAGTYDGSDRGTAAAATLTPSAASVGTGRTFTASAAVFASADVGREIWRKPNRDTGEGEGRATITGYTSPTIVTCEITVAFDGVTAIPAGDWYITASEIHGLWHMEGESASVVADGAVIADGGVSGDYPAQTVSGGSLTLDEEAAVVHVGWPFEGFIQTHNLEMGGRSGPAQAKPRNVFKMFIRFLNTLGATYGTDLYDLKEIEHRDLGNDALDRPAPVFSGIVELYNRDKTERAGEKHVFVSQRLPLPCVVQFIDVHYDTTDE
jgi:hypothetical protein